MIILDTNVISEPCCQSRPGRVGLGYSTARSLLCATPINQAEALYGIAALPDGRRRALASAAETVVAG